MTKRDCLYSTGPEVRGRRTLQELNAVCPVFQYETDAHEPDDLEFELSWNRELWADVVRADNGTVLIPTDVRWG